MASHDTEPPLRTQSNTAGVGPGRRVARLVHEARLDAQARQQPAGGEGGHDSQVQRAAGAVLRHHGQGVLFQGVQPGADLPAVVLPGLGQLHAPPGAPKERHAQVVLQRIDLSADGALGQRQFLGRPREALVAGRRLEGKQGVGAGDLLAHDGVGARGRAGGRSFDRSFGRSPGRLTQDPDYRGLRMDDPDRRGPGRRISEFLKRTGYCINVV